MRRHILSIGREAAAWARQGQLIVLDAARRPPMAALADHQERVVVFVHGFGAAGAVFTPLRRTVERELAIPTLDVSYGSHWPFERVTALLKETIESVLPRDGHPAARSVDLVGHSLGGLVARWYLQELDGARHVRRLVTLATPHAGTRSARIAPGPLRSALLPDGPVVRRLARGRERASDVVHTALVASRDMMVTPPASAAALPDAHVRWFDELGHNAMLYDLDVHRAVLDALRSPTAADASADSADGADAAGRSDD